LIGWYTQTLPGIDPPETVHAYAVGSVERVSVSIVFFFFLESPMPSGWPFATGALSGVVYSGQMLFGRHVRWCPDATPLGNTV